jgi:uncharacterized protein
MNALATETSPYLLQHADNPVAWYPWSQTALDKARQENKPILLSIGYSACHWCHVMAHESFEDEATANLMNTLFINIKVDREERPDLDKIYQAAHHLLTRRNGGWPLTMFLTPEDHAPFFGGTYFPPEPRYGLPGFKDILSGIAEFYRERRADIETQSLSLIDALRSMDQSDSRPRTTDRPLLDSGPLIAARRQLEQSFDPRFGGFGQAPKFPHPGNIERLLRHYAASRAHGEADEGALQIALYTLEQMTHGGVYDQLAGGFCRYSVDDRWMIPHFEKMLYDNGPLLGLYSAAYQITGLTVFKKTAVETADWVLRDMQAPDGGFYSSLDADSEGHEGKFYVWDRAEVEGLLDAESYRIFARHFGLDRAANFEGRWHLHVYVPIAQLSAEFNLPEARIVQTLDTARRSLLEVRNRRVWPARDDKVLVSWNALMIKGLASAARVFERDDYLRAAQAALDFIRTRMLRDGRLLATAKDGRAHLNAYLDDYAFLLDALLTLLQNRYRSEELELAVQLAETLLQQFEDPEAHGFYFTSHDHEQLLHRSKPLLDESLPSGAGIASFALNRLGHILSEPRYSEAAQGALRNALGSVHEYPIAHTAFLLALEEQLRPPVITILRGQGAELADWQKHCLQHYAPTRLTLALDSQVLALPGPRVLPESSITPRAYICEGPQCSAPILDRDSLIEQLRTTEVAQFSTRSE